MIPKKQSGLFLSHNGLEQSLHHLPKITMPS
jgi:hypothetical protein